MSLACRKKTNPLKHDTAAQQAVVIPMPTASHYQGLTIRYIERTASVVLRLSLGRRLANLYLLPVAQRTNAFLTNGVVDRPWVVGRKFGSHVHHLKEK